MEVYFRVILPTRRPTDGDLPGWTQEQLAEQMTVAGHTMHQTTVAKLESASRPTNVGEIGAIASIFGVSMAALFDYSTEGQRGVGRCTRTGSRRSVQR